MAAPELPTQGYSVTGGAVAVPLVYMNTASHKPQPSTYQVCSSIFRSRPSVSCMHARHSRQLIIKLTRLAQAGSWERALEVLRDEQTANMHARAAARAQGEVSHAVLPSKGGSGR